MPRAMRASCWYLMATTTTRSLPLGPTGPTLRPRASKRPIGSPTSRAGGSRRHERGFNGPLPYRPLAELTAPSARLALCHGPDAKYGLRDRQIDRPGEAICRVVASYQG